MRVLSTPGGWILVLIFILTIWNPATLALHASSTVWTLNGAVWLAKLALILFGIEAVARQSTRVDLSSAPPGTRLPTAPFVVAHNVGWYLYLQLSRRVTAAYGLESHL